MLVPPLYSGHLSREMFPVSVCPLASRFQAKTLNTALWLACSDIENEIGT